MKNEIKDMITELAGDFIETALYEIPFSSPKEVRDALMQLAEEIESMDEHDIFDNLVEVGEQGADFEEDAGEEVLAEV